MADHDHVFKLLFAHPVGLVKGQASLLLRQLALKFGPLDGATRARVESAAPDQLTLWGERLLVAPTLAEVFAAS